MARTRPALEKAVNEILIEHGSDGKRLSFRQAERITGLSPATIGELAKGNARTAESIRRFAVGIGADAERLLLLAGFVPESSDRMPVSVGAPKIDVSDAVYENSGLTEEDHECLTRFGRALARAPLGRERELWREVLRRNAELLELSSSRVD